ncbi:non-functional NADPH-dependent codeinone reductase 2-like [Magnolia sinica]|uniref:non-functional NADPH-dependent codeinone reductase 2-like n=1 Tax=Magnolia sinica TaxID=86752 RepID=UPI002658F53A|nr:non-functional NADPH-dependent codeinone reductase 2-like [Magnolia sinica]
MAGKETNGVALAINFPPQTEKETGSIKAVQSLGGPTLAKEVVIHEKVEAAVPAKEEKCDTQLEGVAVLVKEEKDDRFGNQPTVTLNSGRKMPLLGTGTACFPLPPIEDLKKAILDAMEVGYRHFDSAASYQSEEGLGVAIAEALEKGLIKSRDELFITTKLWCNNACPERVLPAIRESLRKLRLEYVDLYLIHFPARFKEEILEMPCVKDDMLPFDMKSTWEAMEEVNKLGLAKSIGVSNLTCKKLTDLLAHAKIPPAVNQVEMHPVWQQKKLRDFYAEKGIHVSAYSPLGAKEWGFDVVLGNALLIDIARAKGKSVAQIALRWGFQQGVSLIPKSFNKGRLKQNFAILDWQLTEEELQQIGTIPQKRIMITPEFIFPDGIFKSPEELWDGEM